MLLFAGFYDATDGKERMINSCPPFGESQGKLHKTLARTRNYVQDTSYSDNPTNPSLYTSRFSAKVNESCRYRSVDGLVAIGRGRVEPEGA